MRPREETIQSPTISNTVITGKINWFNRINMSFSIAGFK